MIPLAAVLFCSLTVAPLAAAMTAPTSTAGKSRTDAAEYAAGCNVHLEGDLPRAARARAARLKESLTKHVPNVVV